MTVSDKPQVLFIGDLDESLPEFKEFSTKFEVVKYKISTEEDLINKFKTEFKDIQAIYGSWLGFVPVGGFKGDILKNAPAHLKVISICSVGYDGYDGKGMREKDIVLTHVPSEGAAEPVADLVLFNTLASFRQFNKYEKPFNPEHNHTVKLRKLLDNSSSFDTKSGSVVLSSNSTDYHFGHYINERPNLNPRNHNAVIVGFGNIGKTIGKKLSDLGMNIHYIKRSPLSKQEEEQLGYKAIYHPNILSTKSIADLIVIACPATPETEHLINKDVIDSIENPFRIINIGRGIIIDESALVDGLKSGKVLFAGLDVYEQEPRVNEELFGRQDVILTPHIGASTVENFDFTAIQALKNIENVLLQNGSGLNTVN
ncbi:alpha-ketoisocaproate reductase [Scheffersomyces amazonensis]|uniref:alpha-ketoisocaproate reductase n=1 Tax=Scheffersomyces amazonensis TaxID=1078765 RepID=UPI00315D9ABA